VKLGPAVAAPCAVVLAACGLAGGSKGPGVVAQRPLAAPPVTAGDLDGRALIAEVSTRAAQLGAGAPSVVASGTVVENG
jgi:hypothetical protein